jgi:hypothetical protein
MTRGIKRHRRRGSYVVLLVAFAALGVWASYALAGNDTGPVTVNVEYHNDDCGDTQGKRVIGTDILNRSGDTLSVVHKVHGADPGTYDLYLYDAAGCAYIAYLGKYKVNGGGDGSKSNTADVSGTSGRFFVCDQNQSTPNFYDCSLTGKLGKNQGVASTVTVTT